MKHKLTDHNIHENINKLNYVKVFTVGLFSVVPERIHPILDYITSPGRFCQRLSRNSYEALNF